LPDHSDLDFDNDDGVDPDDDPDTQPQTDPDKLNQTEEMVRQLPTLRIGDSGEDVQTLQGLLNARIDGRDLAEDGHFGQQTEQAVKDFQAWVGISSDGIVGRSETWPALLLVSV
jgi:peptidoglycan hydrolase-like protein with peptidoglycan-binding domain